MPGLTTYQDSSRREDVKGGKTYKKFAEFLFKRFGKGVKKSGRKAK